MRTRRVAGSLIVPMALIASVMIAPVPASANDGADSPASAAPASVDVSAPSAKAKCLKNGGVMGFAALGAARIRQAKVQVFAAAPNDKPGVFSKELTLQGSAWTNDAGGFQVSASCLPKTFVVRVSGGRVAGKMNRQVLTGIGRAGEAGTIVTPATSVAVQYMKKHGADSKQALKRVSRYLKIVKLGNGAIDLGATTWAKNKGFSPARFLKASAKHGGIQKFARKLAVKAKGKNTRSFRPKGYVKPMRPGFPKAGSDGSPRSRAKNVRAANRGTTRGGVSSIMNSVAGKMAFNATCALLPPSPPTNLACASPDSSQMNEIENQLVAITQALGVLQEEVVAIQDTLNVMETQLTEMQGQLTEIEAQNSDSIQLSLQNAANTAQQQYQDAYSSASVSTVYQQVNEAYNDLVILGSLSPPSSWTPVAVGANNSQVCQTMYSAYNITSGTYAGQNPLGTCTDFLAQTQAFAGANPTYYSNLYKGIVGGTGLPQDDLLIWTYQAMTTFGGNVPVTASTVSSIQSQAAQLGQLMDLGFALAAIGQEFTYGATTGQYTSCPNLTTSGTFPGTTTLNVSSACATIQSGLFAASVQNYQAATIAVPPSGTVADPRTNYVWWSYPTDLTNSTASSGGYPFWPGAPDGTYTTSTGSPLQQWAFTPNYSTACCNTAYLWSTMYPSNPQPKLLANSPSYTFAMASEAQNQSLFSNLLLTDPTSVGGTLAQQGFQGVGQNKYGMNWTNIGANPEVMENLVTSLYWQSTTTMPSSTAACTGYPAGQKGNSFCVAATEQVYDPYPTKVTKTLTGEQIISGVMATQSWNLNTKQLPDSSTLTTCPTVGTAYNYGAGTTTSIGVCWKDTFGLMVDTAAASSANGGTGALPPFWAPSMLTGVPTAGVPALTVTAPTPVTATS